MTKFTCNLFGAASIRLVNNVANFLTGFHRRFLDWSFHTSRHVYPNDKHCSIQQAHSKWHEVSANGLADIMLASNLVAKMIDGSGDSGHFHLFDRFGIDDAFAGFEWRLLSPKLSNVLEGCFLDFLRGFPSLKMGEFLGCVLTETIVAGNAVEEDATDQLNESPRFQTLDTCLLGNKCIAFNGVELDVDLIQWCIGVGVDVSFVRVFCDFVL